MDRPARPSTPSLQRLRAVVTRRRLRAGFLLVLLVAGASLAYGAATGATTATRQGVPTAPATANHTVITESAKFGTIIAYAPNGSVLYYNNSHTKYFDVDPVANASMTVEYTVTDNIYTKTPRCQGPPCTRNAIERVNLTTGNVTQIYARYAPAEAAAEWHDADRINETHVVVADMVDDEVYAVDTRTGMIEWSWGAQSEFPVAGGGPYPGDWAHINDVELLESGRVMVSLRNQDQVVFVDPQTGMIESMTLGAENAHSIQYEQHNPDYIPAERGGPAIVVADSENGRVEEFQRRNGSWVRTWQWSDERMQWPRDADRLPNGNTLVVDTNGKRVLEVNQRGQVVWQVELSHPYDAERLETGDESTGGRSAAALGLTSRTGVDTEAGDPIGAALFEGVTDAFRALVPSRIANGLFYVAPAWMGPTAFGAAIVAVLTGLAWAAVEVGWFLRGRVGVRSPLYRRER